VYSQEAYLLLEELHNFVYGDAPVLINIELLKLLVELLLHFFIFAFLGNHKFCVLRLAP